MPTSAGRQGRNRPFNPAGESGQLGCVYYSSFPAVLVLLLYINVGAASPRIPVRVLKENYRPDHCSWSQDPQLVQSPSSTVHSRFYSPSDITSALLDRSSTGMKSWALHLPQAGAAALVHWPRTFQRYVANKFLRAAAAPPPEVGDKGGPKATTSVRMVTPFLVFWSFAMRNLMCSGSYHNLDSREMMMCSWQKCSSFGNQDL